MQAIFTMSIAHGVRVAFVAFAPYADTASLLDLPAARALAGLKVPNRPAIRFSAAGRHGGATEADQVN